MDEPSIRKNYIYNLLLTFANLVFPLVTFTHASRILSPTGIGSTSFAASVVSYFGMFASLGIPTYGIRLCAGLRDHPDQLSKAVQELCIINAITASVSLLALYICSAFIPRLYEIRILLLIYAIGMICGILELPWLFNALEQYRYITLRSLVIRCIMAAAILFFIQRKTDYILYAVIIVGGSFLTSIVNIHHARLYVSFLPKTKLELKQHLRPVLLFFLMSVATTVYLNLDNVMLGFLTDNHTVGVYATAVKIKSILTGVVISGGVVLLPRMSALHTKNNQKSFWEYASKTFFFSALISVPLAAFFIICASESIDILSGTEFIESVPAMRIIMPTIVLIGFSNVTGIQIMIPRGEEKKVLISEVTGALTDVILNALLIPIYGAAGAAMGTLMAELAVLLVQIWYLRDDLSTLLSEFRFLHISVAIMMAILSIFLLRPILNGYLIDIHSIIRLLIYFMIFFGVYGISLILQKDEITLDMLHYGISLIRKR